MVGGLEHEQSDEGKQACLLFLDSKVSLDLVGWSGKERRD